jgi:hypothetical protein
MKKGQSMRVLPSLVRLSLSLFFTLGIWGCRERPDQIEVEQVLGNRIVSLFKELESTTPGTIATNLADLHASLGRPYPHAWHDQLNQFGNMAGFSNSIYEKYVFFPRGLSVGQVEGELLLMSARPFPNRKKALGRIVITKPGRSDLRYLVSWVEEQRLQQLLSNAGINTPKPVLKSRPPPAPAPAEEFRPSQWSKTAKYFYAVAGLSGLGVERGGLLQWWTFALVASLPALGVVWVVWRWLKRRPRSN